ncbi:probable purine permease 11 isoform X1 [Cryptomeria japonica]|uniref:probable purine permease 11 isoform X1 n=1 Tax=Cryptomeria japonica TaxID=3369 RepID=UPI0025AC0D7A|nr:probable purine permease 11 isoform X1 [Cryptomeria japonica]
MEDNKGDQLQETNSYDTHHSGGLSVESQNIQLMSNASERKLPLRSGAHHWVLVSLSIVALVGGQCSATLLSRFYFERGGNSIWLLTLIPNVGWPVLILPLLFARKHHPHSTNPLKPKIFCIYICLGLLLTGDNFLYTWGISFLPVSTFSILCSTQLAFNAIFAYLMVGQKIGPYVLNSLVLLTFSAVLLGLSHSSNTTQGEISSSHFILGYVYTISASVVIGLILPLMQVVFTKVLGQESLTAVLEMQIYTSVVATVVCVVGLCSSGQLRRIREEANAFTEGKLAYSMTLIWTAIGWQIHSVGLIGLISLVSSLFSTVISTVALPLVPVLAVVFFHDIMEAPKIMALILGMWGFASYVYGGYMDSKVVQVDQIQSEQISTLV